MKGDMKRRVVIELEEDEFKALEFVKRVLGLSWRDLLIMGISEVNRWPEWKEIESKINEELKKIKKEG